MSGVNVGPLRREVLLDRRRHFDGRIHAQRLCGCEPASVTPQNLTPQTWSPSSSWSARPDTPPDPESGCPRSPASPAAASAGRPAADAGTHRLKSALFLAACCSQRSPESKTYYQRKRAEGKRRNAARHLPGPPPLRHHPRDAQDRHPIGPRCFWRFVGLQMPQVRASGGLQPRRSVRSLSVVSVTQRSTPPCRQPRHTQSGRSQRPE